MNYFIDENSDFLSHHGILGQKWGVRRFQNKDGSLTSAGKNHYKTTDQTLEQEHFPKKKSFDNKYEKKAERQKEKSLSAAKAHLKALGSGDERAARKTEKKALKQLNKYVNAEEKAGNYNAFESYNLNKKYNQTESKIRRLSNKNTNGRYDQKIKDLSEKSSSYKKDADSKQWKSIARSTIADSIASSAGASGYTVRKIRTAKSFQTGKQRMAALVGVYAGTTVPSTYYRVSRR